jgi:membrane-associated protein
VLWTVGITLAGYALGSRVSGIDHYLLPIIAVIVAVSLIPLLLEAWRHSGRHSGNGRGDRGPAEHEGSS